MTFVNDISVIRNSVPYSLYTLITRSTTVGVIAIVLYMNNVAQYTNGNLTYVTGVWTINANICLFNSHIIFPPIILYSALAEACKSSIGREGKENKQDVQAVIHTMPEKGVVRVEKKGITYSNWVKIGDKGVKMEELPQEEREKIANSLIYRPLATIPNIKITKIA